MTSIKCRERVMTNLSYDSKLQKITNSYQDEHVMCMSTKQVNLMTSIKSCRERIMTNLNCTK